jgi:hypothetical protein
MAGTLVGDVLVLVRTNGVSVVPPARRQILWPGAGFLTHL